MQFEQATFVTSNTAHSVTAKLTSHICTQLHQNSFEYYVMNLGWGRGTQGKKKLDESALKTCEWFVAVLGMGQPVKLIMPLVFGVIEI